MLYHKISDERNKWKWIGPSGLEKKTRGTIIIVDTANDMINSGGYNNDQYDKI